MAQDARRPRWWGATPALAAVLLAATAQAEAPALPPGSPPPDTYVAFEAQGVPIDVGLVDLLSRNVHDYTFSSAPTDWVARGGDWDMTYRWSCEPEWSWYGGKDANGVAATWNKRRFAGDVTVEMYAGVKMEDDRQLLYQHPSDLNVALHGDGANLDSGYCFVFAGNRNTATRILKRGEVLAETRDPKALLPIMEDRNLLEDLYDFHRRWFGLRAKLSGDRLQLFKDNELILEAEDPDPLPAGQVALWTHENGMIVSRVRIYYAQEAPLGEFATQDVLDHSPVTTIQEPLISASTTTHAGIQNDFELSVGEWKNRDGSGGATLDLVTPGAGETGHALELLNRYSGGSFAATIMQRRKVPVTDLAHLSFDYRVDSDAKLNFHLHIGGRWYEVVFTGLPTPSPGETILARIPSVVADGEWHHAELDLLGPLQRGVRSRTATVDDIFIGNRNPTGYLLAGFGGNHAGTRCAIDNFYLGRPGGQDVALSWEPQPRAQVAGVVTAFDQQPTTVPPQGAATAERTVQFTAGGSGTYFAHLLPQSADGTWGPPLHYRLDVDVDPPRVVSTAPAADARDSAEEIWVQLEDPGGAGIDPDTVKLTVNGQEFGPDSPAVEFRPEAGELKLDVALAGLNLPDGQPVQAALAPVGDRIGHVMAAPYTWTWTNDYARDRTTPRPPTVTPADGYLVNNDFETDTPESMGEWQSYGGPDGAVILADDSTAASGKRCLRIYNARQGGRFGVRLRNSRFNAGKYRLVSFDYRVPGRLRSDFAVFINPTYRSIRFTDNDNNLHRVGEVPNVQTDDQWHHAEFNLYDLLKADDPKAGYDVRYFVMGDWGWMGNPEGQTYYIDNLQIVPVISGADGVSVTWKAGDASGIAGASWVLDQQPDTDPGTRVMATESGVQGAPAQDGANYLHVRVVDGAGNWSEATHCRLLVDTHRPTVRLVSPDPGSTVCTSTTTWAVEETGIAGVDPASIKVVVNGQEYDTGNRGVAYDPDAGTLAFSGERVSPQPLQLPDGQPVTVQLTGLADFAGNQAELPPALTYTMSYAADNEPPIVRAVTCQNHRTLVTATFEDSLGPWQVPTDLAATMENLTRPEATSIERSQDQPAGGQWCLRIAPGEEGANLAAALQTDDFTAAKYPVLTFDYRMTADVKVDLVLQTADQLLPIRLSDMPQGAIGTARDVVADGAWHRAVVNLNAFLARNQQNTVPIKRILFVDRGQADTPATASLFIDNLILASEGKAPPAFRWEATDPTGIADYSYALDAVPDTVPDEVGEGPTTTFTARGVQRGIWYFHVRARDGAGHWGPPTHYAIIHFGVGAVARTSG